MGMCSKAWFALMRRNLLYRKRYWISSAFEFVLPLLFLILLVVLREVIGDIGQPDIVAPSLPNVDFDVITPLRFHDYLVGLQAKRVCVPRGGRIGTTLGDFFEVCLAGSIEIGNGELAEELNARPVEDFPEVLAEILAQSNTTDQVENELGGLSVEEALQLGFPALLQQCIDEGKFADPKKPLLAQSFTISNTNSYASQIPLIRCNQELCTEQDQDAEPFCERWIVGVAGMESRVTAFLEWIEAEYPQEQDLALFRYFIDQEDMDVYVENSKYETAAYPKLAMGIVFEETTSPSVWSYQLRPNSTLDLSSVGNEEFAFPLRSTPETDRITDAYARSESDACGTAEGSDSCTLEYTENGVLTFQRLVHDFILNQTSTSSTTTPQVGAMSFVPFPEREYQTGGFLSVIRIVLTLFVTLGLLFPVASMVSYIVKEKQFRQKELMKCMSVTESDIEWSWFSTFAIFHTVTAVLAAILSSRLYTSSSLVLLLIFWLFTMISCITFSMAIASTTSKSVRAVMFAVLGFFAGYFLTTAQNFEQGRRTYILLISLHPVAAFSYGIDQITKLESKGLGLSFANASFSDSRSGYTFADTLTMLLVDTVVWGFVSWYLNRAIPPDYGQALPFYFPFTPHYWFPTTASATTNTATAATLRTHAADANAGIPYEAVDAALQKQSSENKTIEIHNLRKTFGEKKIAVDGVSLTMYAGQITALLGPNGAGKTTLISMLTGAVHPSAGSATILGKDIQKELSLIRQDIGIALQHDCLFPDLTVREHVQFFARLKGFYGTLSVAEAEESIDQSMRDVALFDKRHAPSKTLSGGMKRKLSLCMAFCGGSKVVLLDEPTSGMDPFSRRFAWDVIRQYRQDRCIILTTHFMDEADILGDRIAIMANGQLRCAGSPLFLKKAYGVGYQLTIETPSSNNKKSDDEDEETLLDKQRSALVELVEEHVSEAAVLSNVGTELKLQLPVGAASGFPLLLENLDTEVDSKHIVSYGVSMTTMDEVFLLVARGDNPGDAKKMESSRKLVKDDVPEERSAPLAMDLSNESLFLRHVGALVKKRASNFRRDKKAWCCTTLLPSTFVLIGFLFYMRATGNRSLPSLTLDLADLNPDVKEGIVNPISVNPTSFYCLPGQCILDTFVESDSTAEMFNFCLGVEQNLNSCPVDSPTNVLGGLEGFEGISIVESDDVGTVQESSSYLLDSSTAFEASQYGAIWVTKDSSSTVSNSSVTLDDALVAECYANVDNGSQYITYKDCERLRGFGFLIQYNFTGLHTSVLFQALVDQALARTASNDPDLEIKATIAPLPITQTEKSFGSALDSIIVWFLIILSFPFISGAYATFIVEERESKAKHLQTVAGVQPIAYWVSSFIWDVINYQLPLWITIGLMFIFDVEALTTNEKDVFPAILLLLFFYGPAAAGFAYCTSFLFKSPTLCNVVLIITSFVLSIGGTIAVSIMTVIVRAEFASRKLKLATTILTWILRIFPACNLSRGLFFVLNSSFLTLGVENQLSALSGDILLHELIVLACQGVGYTGLAVVLDMWTTNPNAMGFFGKILNFLFCTWAVKADIGTLPEDDDVIAEEKRVLDGDAADDLIVMSKLSKVFSNGKVAVKNMSLGIPPGECFGLLGINGAGKTTTMGMLTAEFAPTGGDARLSGFSIVKEPQKIRRRIGYCPQFDAHFANMTGREHVTLYASVKGIPPAMVAQAVAQKLQEVGLNDFDSDRLCANYSGGMKRRLSIACATIGQPRIVFLDECSTGVDPVARREIWQLVSDMVSNGNVARENRTSVILTTHSMEECEALCPRIGIMANGRLRCLGSAQHLKNKFGQGFQVEIKALDAESGDADFVAHSNVIARSKGITVDGESGLATDDPPFSLAEAVSSLGAVTNDAYLSSMVASGNPQGYTIWKAASTTGVSLADLAIFATNELRVKKIGEFVSQHFPSHIVRERQDMKIRYEVGSENVRISSIFSLLEKNKKTLSLADYGVSQTSLEQVFNLHAAEAEELKRGRTGRTNAATETISELSSQSTNLK